MSGYNYNSRRSKRRGDSGSQRGRSGQNSSYWQDSHYEPFNTYNQYQFPQLVFPHQWNHVSWDNQNNYSDTYRREPIPQNQHLPRHTFNSGQGHTRTSGHASSHKGKSSWSDPRNRHNQKRHSSPSSSRNQSSSQRKVTSPPLGSEEARKKTLAKARDKIKSYLLSFKDKKPEGLENLLSNERQQKRTESTRASPLRLNKPDCSELQLTPSDLKVIGMVNTSGARTSLELALMGNQSVETISTNELKDSSSRTEIAAQSSDDSEKELVANFGCNTFNAPDIKLLGNEERFSMSSSLEGREMGLRDSYKQAERGPPSTYKCSRFTSGSSSPRQLASSEVETSSPYPCAQSSMSNPADNSDQSRDGTNSRSSCEHPSGSSEREPKRSLKNLKQRIIQQFLKMGKNNLKDLINNPRSRKFEFAMNHLMKEHRLLLSRELRTLAQSRIRGQDVENQEHGDPLCDTNSMLDTDIAINFSHLPQEVIEQLGNLLQLNLLDNAESIDFQPITVEDENSVHDLQNIQALQVALLSEEDIKREVIESEKKPVVATEVIGNAVDESVREKDLVEGQLGSTSDFQQNWSAMDSGTGQIEDSLRRPMEYEQKIIIEEGGAVKKPRAESNTWPGYIPLGKGFMNRSGEFGNLFSGCLDTRSTASEAVDGQKNVKDVPCTKEIDGEVVVHPQADSDQISARTFDKVMSPNLAHIRATDEMVDCNSSLQTNVMPSEVLDTELGEDSNKFENNSLIKKSHSERLANDCLTNTDKRVVSCGEDNWNDDSHEEGFDSSHHTSDDIGTNFPASANVIQAKDLLKDLADAQEPSQCSLVADGRGRCSANSDGSLRDNGELLKGSTVADKPIEGSSECTGALFKDSDVINVNTLVRKVSEEMDISTDDPGPRETETKGGDFEELNSVTTRLPDNLQINLNTYGCDENSQLDINEGSSYNVEDTKVNMETNQEFITSEKQNEEVAVTDPHSEAMDGSFVLTGNDTENINVNESIKTHRNISQSASASNEIDISPSKDMQAENIGVDDLCDDKNDLPVAEDIANTTVDKIHVDNSADNYKVVVNVRPVSEKTEEKNGNSFIAVKSIIPEVDDSRGTDSLTAEARQSSINYAAAKYETCNENIQTLPYNVVKIEKCDSDGEDGTSLFEEELQCKNCMDAPGVPEPQRLCSSAETQTSFLCNPFQEVTRVEVSTQTQPPEEFDSDDIQRMLQLLEKSSQLSPELAELLTDHFSSRKATKENESSELSRSVNAEKDCATSASKHKAQCLIHPLNSTVSPSPPISVSENHDVDSTVQTTSLPHTSDLSCPLDGMEPSFRGPSLHGKEGRMSTTKQIRPTKQDDTSTGLNIVQKVRVASKESECSAGVSSVDATDTSSSCAATGKIADIDGGPSGDSMDTRRDFQGTAVGSSSKIVFLKMLEIDKEIQKLMEVKVELYKKLHPSLEIDFPCTDRNSSHSPKSRGLQYANPTTEASSDTVCNRVMLSSNHNTQQMHMGLLTVNNNDPTGSSFTSDRLTSTSTPMVMLPIHYVLGSSAELQNTHLSVPRQKLGECLKTFDTSVVEAVLNSFNLPDCRSRGGDAAVAHSSDHENQNKILGDVGEATPLKSKSCHLDGNNANKGRRHLAPHFSTHEESHQSETNSPLPEAVSLKIQVSEPKLNVSRQRYYGKKKKKSHVQHKTGIATNKMSSRSVGNQENSGIGGNSDAIAGKPIQSDSLMQTGGDELQNRRQAYSCESKHQKENLSRCRSTRHKVENMNHEKESSQSDSSSVVQDRKETHSSVKTKVPTKDDKQSVTDCSPSSKRPIRHSQRMFCQADNSFCRSRRNTGSGSHSDVEVQLQDATEIVKNRERTRSSKGRNSISLHESELSDSVSTVPCKRKVTEILDRSSQDELSKPATQSRSRRSCIRIASNFQDMQPTVMHGNATEMSTKVKTVKVGQTVDVDESAVSARQLRRIQNSNNHDTFLSSEVLNSGLSFESFPSSRSRRHGGGTQKRRPDELEGPPNKVQRLGPKLDLLQWKLQDCFVKVKPLAIETVAHSLPSEELTTTDSVGDQRIRTFSSSSDELSVVEFVGKHMKERVRKEQAQVEGSSNEQDHLGGIPDTFSCQSQPADLRIRPCGNDPSSPVHLSHDLMQSDLPIQLQGHCTLRDVVTQDENSLSTLLSDVLSVTSDGDQSAAKRSGNGDGSERDLQLIADDKDECDRDSTCSYDTPQEGREGTESKHKLSKKHKKDRKPDGIERLVFESHKGPILDIKTVGRHMLAASEDGSVYCYSLKSGKFKRKYEGHNAAVTCLCVIECSNSGVSTELEAASEEQMAPDLFFTGSLDKHLRNFRFKTGELVHNPVNVRSPIQCMDQNWGIVFIGTQTGEVVRFNIKTSSLIGEPMKIGRESVLSLRATKEGARQVLIIGSRNKPITVRDAATGLLLRTVCNSWSHTVYSSVLSSSLVYFGTKTGIIPVVEFTTGDEVCRFKTASGVVCMRIYNNLLFAGCYDGNIYVFSIHDKKLVTSIPGPGKMLLCMDIVKNRIIAGIKDNNKLEAWAFPQELRCHLKEAKHR